MKLFDSHCHLNMKDYDKDIDKVIKRASDAGVVAAMVVGIDLESSRRAMEIAQTYPTCFASVGIHPHDASECSESVLKALEDLASSGSVSAWGEIGLDYNRMYSSKADQQRWFTRQLDIALKRQMPVIIHERDTGGELLAAIKTNFESAVKGVVHCFGGNKNDLYGYLDLGLSIGITGILTQKQRGRDLRNLIKSIPIERILIETDAPFLTPHPEKKQYRRNEPAFLTSVFHKLQNVVGMQMETLAAVLWENTCRTFEIDSGLFESPG